MTLTAKTAFTSAVAMDTFLREAKGVRMCDVINISKCIAKVLHGRHDNQMCLYTLEASAIDILKVEVGNQTMGLEILTTTDDRVRFFFKT